MPRGGTPFGWEPARPAGVRGRACGRRPAPRHRACWIGGPPRRFPPGDGSIDIRSRPPGIDRCRGAAVWSVWIMAAAQSWAAADRLPGAEPRRGAAGSSGRSTREVESGSRAEPLAEAIVLQRGGDTPHRDPRARTAAGTAELRGGWPRTSGRRAPRSPPHRASSRARSLRTSASLSIESPSGRSASFLGRVDGQVLPSGGYSPRAHLPSRPTAARPRGRGSAGAPREIAGFVPDDLVPMAGWTPRMPTGPPAHLPFLGKLVAEPAVYHCQPTGVREIIGPELPRFRGVAAGQACRRLSRCRRGSIPAGR